MRKALPYVQEFVDRESGITFRYFRKRGFRRVRLPGLPGSPEFMAAYAEAQAGHIEIGTTKRSIPGSVSLAIARYYDSRLYFGSLRPSTQVRRRQILEKFRAEHGDKPIAGLPAKFISLSLNRMSPNAARVWLIAIRHLMRFAIETELCRQDPTAGIKVKLPKSDGIHCWTEEEIAAYELAHPIGTKARLALALGLGTAQRLGDVVRMGPQHIRDGWLTVRQSKTGATLQIPIDADLQKVISTTPCQQLTFLTTETGKPYRPTYFCYEFRNWCDQACLPKQCTFHGLRKAACTRLADSGCSAHEIAAISGHATLGEVSRYTKAANQVRLAQNAKRRQNDLATEVSNLDPASVKRPRKPA